MNKQEIKKMPIPNFKEDDYKLIFIILFIIMVFGLPASANYLCVDDMDAYGDAMTPGITGGRIYYVWRDGWDIGPPPVDVVTLPGNLTGSQVYHWNGIGTGLMESTIVRSGMSMPFYYENDGDNAYKPVGGNNPDNPLMYYSEATVATSDLPIGSNWTIGDVRALVLWFYGNPNNDANSTEQMYVALEDGDGHISVVLYDGDMDDIKEASWHEWNIELADFADINLSNVTSISIGFGNEYNTTTPGGAGIVYFDDIRLYPPRCVPSLLQPIGDLDDDCDVDYDDLIIIADNWLLAPSDPKIDLYSDETIDFRDIAELGRAWGEQQIWP